MITNTHFRIFTKNARQCCILFFSLILLVSFYNESEGQPKPEGRSNIVFILADDLGYGSLSSYGATKVTTPNMDRLAKEGKKFTNAYAPSSVCTPTRNTRMF